MFVNKWLLVLVVVTMAAVLDGQTLGGPMHGKVVVCYIASWAVYRVKPGNFGIGELEPSLCTHLVYAFAGLDEATSNIKSLDPWQDLQKDDGRSGYKGFIALKERYPHLKVTIAIGGWNEGSPKYSNMSANPESREKFVKSVLQFLNLYKFDGLDLDWEYPTKRGGVPDDKANYVALVKELKDAFEPHGYILTAALGAGKNTMEAAYDLSKLSRYLDFIHLMSYDYHGTWDGVVGSNAPLRGSSDSDVLSLEFSVKYMLSNGVSPYKLVLGLPMYGRTFILKDPDTKTIEFNKTPVQNQGFKGPYTKENGFMGYNEICLELANKSSTWSYHWDEQSATPYVRNDDKIIAYDNTRSIALKVKMATDYGLGGLMVWSIDTDDFRGECQIEENTYVDFERKYNEIVNDPVLDEALKSLNLPEANRIENLSKRTAYVASNGKLYLRLPEPKFSNFPLMRTINEAATLALEEKRILDEMERVIRENEIDDQKPKKGGAGAITSCFFNLFLSLIFVIKF